MSKTAILVDGGFYRKRAKYLWGERPPQETANGLITYAMRHLREHTATHELYRQTGIPPDAAKNDQSRRNSRL